MNNYLRLSIREKGACSNSILSIYRHVNLHVKFKISLHIIVYEYLLTITR